MTSTLPEDGPVTHRVTSNSHSGSPDLPLLVSVSQAAYELSMSESWLRARIRDGALPVRYFGRQVRIPRASVQELIDNGLETSEAG